MRGIFLASRGQIDAAAIQQAAGCAEGHAELIATVRRLACIEVLDAYERGQLTFRQVWRACEYVGDLPMQRRLLSVAAA